MDEEIEEAQQTPKKRTFPLWDQFVSDKSWIGGTLTELDSAMGPQTTKIKKISIEEWTPDSWVFAVEGEDFTCSFGVKYGGVSPCGPKGAIGFYAMGGLQFYIEKQHK